MTVELSGQRPSKVSNTIRTFIPFGQIIALLLLPRIRSASYNLIHDTDETYNYWEPLHYFVHGTGFQTWEYSPIYAIRSWAYIALHSLPLIPLKHVLTKEQQFYVVRGALGIASAMTEAHLVDTISQVLGTEIAVATLSGLSASTGMFNASTALLPSSFTMYTSTLGLSFALRKNYFYATVAFGIGTIIGWPFSVILFAPLFVFSLFEDQFPVFSYIRGTIVSLQTLLVSTLLDFRYYRIWTLVPLNIVLYNVFSSREGRGPDLFGTEPATYYVKNLILNFNLLVGLALLAVPITLINTRDQMLRLKASTGFLIWFILFTAQAHKEERFMYPAYPALILSSAIGLTSTLEMLRPIFVKIGSAVRVQPSILETSSRYFVLIVSIAASEIRVQSLIKNYSAPLNLFHRLPQGKNYCLGGDWYRFPTSFLLPPNTTLSFVESDFKGLLPGRFVESWHIPTGMNDRNVWSKDKVVPISACDCLINWKAEKSPTHSFYFLDRETGVKKAGYYGYDCTSSESHADRLNRLGQDLFGRKLDSEGKKFEDGALKGAIQRPGVLEG